MAFFPELYDSGKYVDVLAAGSTTFTNGDALVDNGSGYVTTASAGGNVDIRYVAMETKTTGSAAGEKLLAVRTDGVTFTADTDANPAQTDVGTEADLAGAGTIDPDASTDDVFYIEAIVGAVTANKVRGHFTRGVPNS